MLAAGILDGVLIAITVSVAAYQQWAAGQDQSPGEEPGESRQSA